ncbi:hypothetical protein AAE478_004433 [Parahypoxylon ruwenzoriense]
MATSSESSGVASLELPITMNKATPETPPTRAGTTMRPQKPDRIALPDSSGKPTMEGLTDSGYCSQSTTPNEKPPESTRAVSIQEGLSYFPFPKKKKISFINKEIDELARERFRAIQSYLEKLLLEEIRSHQKPGTKYKPMSMRLAMMGTSDGDARPHIVVLCQSAHEGLIRRFAKQNIITDICRPGDQNTPSFEIVVLGNAPRLRTTVVYANVITTAKIDWPSPPKNTLCGVPISFRHFPSGRRQNATLGGIIKVVTAAGDVELFGMTTAHAICRWNHDKGFPEGDIFLEEELPGVPSREGIVIDSDEKEGTETCEIDEDETEIDVERFVQDNAPPETTVDADAEYELLKFDEITLIGWIGENKETGELLHTGKRYDWVLFDSRSYEMNYIPEDSTDLMDSMDSEVQLKVSQKRPGAIGNRPVVVVSRSTGCKKGILTSEPGRILLDDGEEFVDSFMISMTGNSDFQDGDSGSWVVDTTNYEVYGQLVASDILGGGYIIPMVDILCDIKSRLGARSVGFPDAADILAAQVFMGLPSFRPTFPFARPALGDPRGIWDDSQLQSTKKHVMSTVSEFHDSGYSSTDILSGNCSYDWIRDS